ncbi:hypothetical protein MANES_01G053875v8 [Manihot esculenta]|uniref:Uncharacterized protein n=1 Tax=Manihot esculenta TaxID=3983 RepID=A0A2C9WKD1_MANES|nr:hypothetical protein MANES_01G053875v8 [Manihot esculenta]
MIDDHELVTSDQASFPPIVASSQADLFQVRDGDVLFPHLPASTTASFPTSFLPLMLQETNSELPCLADWNPFSWNTGFFVIRSRNIHRKDTF